MEGQVVFNVSGEDQVARPGEYVAIPDGAMHAFQAIGDSQARLFILNAPGHMHKAFFTGIGRALPDGQRSLPEPSAPDLGMVLKVAKEVGMTISAP